jgi:hypothetical protein
MVAFSRTCRRFVRRRDKDTLAMDDLQIFRRVVTEPLTESTAAASIWRRKKTRLAAKKGRSEEILFTD